MMKLEGLLNSLWACLIDEIQHDYRESTLLIKLKEPETGKEHTLLFRDIQAILWTMVGVEGKINKKVYPELTCVLLKDVGLSTKDKWLRSYPTHFNICIEIMDRALLILASVIEVDDIPFELYT